MGVAYRYSCVSVQGAVFDHVAYCVLAPAGKGAAVADSLRRDPSMGLYAAGADRRRARPRLVDNAAIRRQPAAGDAPHDRPAV